MFHYSSYWKTWSRVLLAENGQYVELNLTPIPSCYSSSWKDDVMPEKIRWHGTPPDRNDKVLKILPSSVSSMMEENIGQELTERLLTFNYLNGKIVCN